MKIGTSFLLALSLFYGQSSFASDAFSAIKCGSEIPKNLIGRHVKNEKVVAIEARHKKLGLKALGTDEISEGLLSEYWTICGHEFVLLTDKNFLIHDVLQVPDHSVESLEFTGKCNIDNKEKPEIIFALLNKEEGVKLLSARSAWIVNEKKRTFKKVSTNGMRCERLDQ
jgi:hypothetical protein